MAIQSLFLVNVFSANHLDFYFVKWSRWRRIQDLESKLESFDLHSDGFMV